MPAWPPPALSGFSGRKQLLNPQDSVPENDEPAPEQAAAPARPKRRASLLQELLETVLLTLILFTVTRISVQNFQVQGTSMVPTMQNGERILVEKVSYHFHLPNRGDIVVFKYPLDTSQDFIKRVIGLPGDHIAIKMYQGVYRTFVNGKMLDEPYINGVQDAPYPASCAAVKTCVPYVVPSNDLFVMGDNRNSSYDSRSWGPMPMSDMIGRAFIAYWPLSDLSLIPNQFSYAPSGH